MGDAADWAEGHERADYGERDCVARRTDEIKLPVSLHEDYCDGPLLSLVDADGKGVAQFDADYPDAQRDAQRVVDTLNAIFGRLEQMERDLGRARSTLHEWQVANRNRVWVARAQAAEAKLNESQAVGSRIQEEAMGKPGPLSDSDVIGELVALRAKLEAAQADRAKLHEAVMLCLAGLVPTPEHGFLDDLRPQHAVNHALEMRGVVEDLQNRASTAEAKLERVREKAHAWATDENYARRAAALQSGDPRPEGQDVEEGIAEHMQRRAAIDWCGREILAVIEGDRGDGEREV